MTSAASYLWKEREYTNIIRDRQHTKQIKIINDGRNRHRAFAVAPKTEAAENTNSKNIWVSYIFVRKRPEMKFTELESKLFLSKDFRHEGTTFALL